MKKILALILVLILALPLMASAVAESGQVVLSVGSAFTTFFYPYFQGTMIGYAFFHMLSFPPYKSAFKVIIGYSKSRQD